MQTLVNAYIIAALTRATLFQLPTAIRFVLSLGEVMRWIMNRSSTSKE